MWCPEVSLGKHGIKAHFVLLYTTTGFLSCTYSLAYSQNRCQVVKKHLSQNIKSGGKFFLE